MDLKVHANLIRTLNLSLKSHRLCAAKGVFEALSTPESGVQTKKGFRPQRIKIGYPCHSESFKVLLIDLIRTGKEDERIHQALPPNDEQEDKVLILIEFVLNQDEGVFNLIEL